MVKVGIPWNYKAEADKYGMNDCTVSPRYDNLKEEMLNYTYLSNAEYLVRCILNKAMKYMMTNIAKSMKSTSYGNEGWHISLENVIGIILDCDYKDLSSDFESTFHKTNPFETLNQVQKRHSKYAHLGKALKDTVTNFGQTGYDGLKGPFYCGFADILTVSQFNMFITAPLTTSSRIEVAAKYSGNSGMILEMNNTMGYSQYTKGLDVTWISRYREEDQRYIVYIYKHII